MDVGYERPDLAVIKIDNLVTFYVEIVGEKKVWLVPPSEASALRVSLRLADSAVMRFLDEKISLVGSDGRAAELSIGPIFYHVMCHESQAKGRDCSSSEDSPVAVGAPEVAKGYWASGGDFVDVHKFSSKLPFKGAMDTLEEGAWFGHQMRGLRRYFLTLNSSPLSFTSEFSVRLPDVEVNGRIYGLPTLTYRATSEKICRVLSVD